MVHIVDPRGTLKRLMAKQRLHAPGSVNTLTGSDWWSAHAHEEAVSASNIYLSYLTAKLQSHLADAIKRGLTFDQ